MSLAGRDASKNGGRDLKLVRVIYIDEARSNREERIFTWATIIVKDSRWLAVERDAERIIETLVPEELYSRTSSFTLAIFLLVTIYGSAGGTKTAKLCGLRF